LPLDVRRIDRSWIFSRSFLAKGVSTHSDARFGLGLFFFFALVIRALPFKDFFELCFHFLVSFLVGLLVGAL